VLVHPVCSCPSPTLLLGLFFFLKPFSAGGPWLYDPYSFQPMDSQFLVVKLKNVGFRRGIVFEEAPPFFVFFFLFFPALPIFFFAYFVAGIPASRSVQQRRRRVLMA